MARLALYRAYRPATFSEVVGQDHIITILKNQVREQRLSHAYLFCGSRGTGKTSSAKILARAINCLSPHDGEPCGECAQCKIASDDCPDIVEIDAASHTGVDNVRELIEQAQFAPLQLRYRVFIIDEVHMLSASAFNALLKTLEEPPVHVVFILATTEPQKLPATIISRCQRFDFRRLTIAQIVARLQTVLQAAGASIEPDGLRVIARAADGGMRDALSLADQCLAFTDKTITQQDVYDVLGSVGQETLFALSKALLTGDAVTCLQALDTLVRSGRDLTVFTSDLVQYLRSLLLVKTCGDCADLLDCTADQLAQYQKLTRDVDEARILYAMEQLLKIEPTLRYLSTARVLVESTFVRICRPVDDASREALAARVALLEQAPRSSIPVASTPPQPSEVPRADEAPIFDDVPPPSEEPPWEQPQAEPPKTKPLPPKPIAKAQASEAPQPASAASVPSDDPQALWTAVKQRIGAINPIVLFAVKNSVGVRLSDDTLTVQFPATEESRLEIASSARNFAVAQQAAQEIRPNTTIVFQSDKLKDGEEQLCALFGSALTIE